jgi:predicted DNA-binding transcriptional regulator AlpA
MAHKYQNVVNTITGVPSHDPDGRAAVLISGPKLRRYLDVSAVTLWRWRNDEKAEFPGATMINGRLYFSWDEVLAWLAKQKRAA